MTSTTTTTTTSPSETTITADPDLPVIRIVRELAAPPSKVFRAHVDPELLVQWLGPHDIEMQVEHYDCRTGGSYRYVHARGEERYAFHGCFHEVRPDLLIVQTFAFDGEPDAVALERMVLEDLGNGRTRLTATSLCESFAHRDGILASGMESGVRDSYERLDALLV